MAALRTGSLRLRLFLGAGSAIFIALAIAWAGMLWLFEHHIERRAANELTQYAMQLIAHLELAPDGTPVIDDPPSAPRFERPSSGLYWQVTGVGGHVRSRSLWDEVLPQSPVDSPDERLSHVSAGPFRQDVLLLERGVWPDGSTEPVFVQVALDKEELRLSRNEFGRELALSLMLLWVVLVLAAAAQVQLGLRPLSRIRKDLQLLQQSPAARLDASYPKEIEPLSEAINKLAEAREKDLLRMRRRAADLAHSLKTPLAALSAQSRRARAAGATDAADGLDRVIAAAAAAVEAELARARAARIRDRGASSVSSPHDVAECVVAVVERTDIGARLVFEVDIADQVRVPVAADDLTELMGALVENAARFARRRVRIRADEHGTRTTLHVEDDGKGLDIDVEKALMRGGRLDETGSGHDGIGLSLVYDLSEATGAELTLGRSDLGGLKTSICWNRPS